MIRLDLTSLEHSDIKYKISKFPDGQQSIEILYADQLVPISMPFEVEIASRLNSFRDLELIICATQALRNLRFENISLYVPYFLGARSDRRFAAGGVNYLKQVICPIINSQNYFRVTVLDPHSDILEACLNNFDKDNNYNLVKFAFAHIPNPEKIILVSPDAGAYKKIHDVAKVADVREILVATKIRDLQTGEIILTHIDHVEGKRDRDIVIVDDICDGGRTFTEIAKVIRASENPETPNRIYLVVTHGIFSAGFEKLSDYFDGVFCTNSVKDVNFDTVKAQSRQDDPNFVKQLNIF